ncbi:MAG TPA: RNA methyltransferase, partial [Anaerolineaceae bacterium]|nr:RNA methyltransferase [Anaerolineaceae bacterium]
FTQAEMSTPPVFRQCTQKSCRFRYPEAAGQSDSTSCPRCGHPTQIVPLPHIPPDPNPRQPTVPGPQVEALLDNIRSAFNVGSMFRTADGAGLRHLHLCGLTPPPTHPRVSKTALGAETIVEWSIYPNAVDCARKLKSNGMRIWALEVSEGSVSLPEITGELAGSPIVLVVGSEVAGVDPGILEMCDRKIWIPMVGFKRTLNVAIAFGITAYWLRFGGWT